jgi:hypothetical protein
MTVQAKFFVQNTEGTPDGKSAAAKVKMSAVCRGVENAGWASATPVGNLEMFILNQDAFAQFEKGAEYLLTFERVAKPEAGDGHQPQPVSTKSGALVCAVCGCVPIYVSTDWRDHSLENLDWSSHQERFGG